ncbi:palmitoyltransferase, putative [Plasmodium berghei]|uniref:protein S-acyltransferase n=2 Tax=Plasmodium berghei TaxID=5821 RepID=A0A509AU94_PLABA|nr:palmitoyltransferase DHHC4, putative [Plasmodium berghei ANKA]SCM26299.1 palmitoyltransferase, putative [Plasmodium berghei]SCN28381.1 palmitoyltransferase, putative [Plasmodium berghei]SCO62577.1 palmitoyltransferase, putative [Plasmodium berghei]SCO64134.1 palmitoyltransferase, putative [Plasmodium berghei]VUC58268.1 palmitoyltransferase DHHC4, putative [Plasmodium berghei ANKA]|eukprot:XP_034424031.1 palmitoyltransferase DHHC4, putative [Plasmodium berghei ANKA]
MKIFKSNKSLERVNFDKINNVQIYGENNIHCNGLFISGPSFLAVTSSFLMMVIPVAIFHAFTSPWLFKKDIYLVTVFNLLFFVLTIYTFFKTSFMDPGIIPRQNSVLSLYDAIIDQRRGAQPPKQKEVLINGVFYKLKYCYTCNIYRGIRTVHCSICDNCVEKFDHHCPWVGNCIGARNYKYFIYFIFNLYILICITLGASIYKLTICMTILSNKGYNSEKIFIHIWSLATDSIILIIYTVLTLWFVIGLLCYHIYTIVTNQTTYEQIKTFYQNDNPFNIGVLNNIKEILFTKVRPSYINFENPKLQVIDQYSSHNIITYSDKCISIDQGIANISLQVSIGDKECNIIKDDIFDDNIHDEIEMKTDSQLLKKHDDKFIEKNKNITSKNAFLSTERKSLKGGNEYNSLNSLGINAESKSNNFKNKRTSKKKTENVNTPKINIISNREIGKSVRSKDYKNKIITKISKIKLIKTKKKNFSEELNNDIEINNYQDKCIIDVNNNLGSLYIRNDISSGSKTNNVVFSGMDNELDETYYYSSRANNLADINKKKQNKKYYIISINWEKNNTTTKGVENDTDYYNDNNNNDIYNMNIHKEKMIKTNKIHENIHESKYKHYNNITRVRKKVEYKLLFKKKIPFILKHKNKIQTFYMISDPKTENKYIHPHSTENIEHENPSEILCIDNISIADNEKEFKKINYLKKKSSHKIHQSNYSEANTNKLKNVFSDKYSSFDFLNDINCNKYDDTNIIDYNANRESLGKLENKESNKKLNRKRKEESIIGIRKNVVLCIYNYNTKGNSGELPNKEKKITNLEKKNNLECKIVIYNIRDKKEKLITLLKYKRKGGKKHDSKISLAYLSQINNMDLDDFSQIYKRRYTKIYQWKCKKIQQKIIRRKKIKLLSRSSHKNIYTYYNNNKCLLANLNNLSDFQINNNELIKRYYQHNNLYSTAIKHNQLDNVKLYSYLTHMKNAQNRLDIKKKSKASRFFDLFTAFALIINCINIPSNNDNEY